jgi:DNA-binding transcriptional LysR family regulator
MRSLNLDQLRTLVEVVEAGSFSAAARRLNLAQPSVSLQIRELETRCGVRLIERQRLGKGTQATTPGQRLVDHAKRIFRECEAAEAAMHRFKEGWLGRVHVGTTLTALMYELPPILTQLRTEHPGIELLVTNMPTRDTVERIIQGTIDLGLVTLPVEDARLRVTPLRPEMLVAILPAGTNDVPDQLTPEYVARGPLVIEHARGAVHALIMRWLADHLPLPNPPMHIGPIEAVKKVVASGIGFSIVPDIAVSEPNPAIIVRPLSPPIACTLALAEHREKQDEPALRIVRNALLGLRDDAWPSLWPAQASRSRARGLP